MSEFGLAIAQFKAAEAATTDLDAKARALENVAVSHVQMNDLEEAVRFFEIAMSLREEEASPMSVNNLAGIYNQLNQPKKVLSVLALIDWSTVSGPAKRMAWINRLSAARTIDPQSEETRQAYEDLITTFPVPEYPQQVATVARTAVMIGDSGHVKKMLDASQALIDQQPAFSAEWMPDLKPLFRMGENWGQLGFDQLPWAARWALTRELSQTRWEVERATSATQFRTQHVHRCHPRCHHKREGHPWCTAAIGLPQRCDQRRTTDNKPDDVARPSFSAAHRQ